MYQLVERKKKLKIQTIFQVNKSHILKRLFANKAFTKQYFNDRNGLLPYLLQYIYYISECYFL